MTIVLAWQFSRTRLRESDDEVLPPASLALSEGQEENVRNSWKAQEQDLLEYSTGIDPGLRGCCLRRAHSDYRVLHLVSPHGEVHAVRAVAAQSPINQVP